METCSVCGTETPRVEEGDILCTACAAEAIQPLIDAEWDRLFAERAAEAPVLYLAA